MYQEMTGHSKQYKLDKQTDIEIIFDDRLIWCASSSGGKFLHVEFMSYIYTHFNMATMGTSEHSRKRQVWTKQVVFINSYFLDFERQNPKTMSDFRLMLVKAVWKIRHHIHLQMLNSPHFDAYTH